MEKIWLLVLSSFLLRYLLFAGGAWLLFYIFLKGRIAYKKIQLKFPSSHDYRREIGFSMVTFVIFSIYAMVLFYPPFKKASLIYSDFSEYGWGYFVLSVIISLLLHDTYFYWMHRIIHHPKLFKIFHLVHHKSTNPTPWASFSFAPLEGLLEGAIIFIIAFTIPIHLAGIITFLFIMTIFNVYGHLGYEIYPESFLKSFVGRWFNTSVNHNMHHKYFNGNYGLYFRFWDEWMGTTHSKYNEELSEVKGRKKIDSYSLNSKHNVTS
jgi:Delta7-sterol 5-desaturase